MVWCGTGIGNDERNGMLKSQSCSRAAGGLVRHREAKLLAVESLQLLEYRSCLALVCRPAV